MADIPQLLSAKHVAERFDVPVLTVYKMVSAGEIPAECVVRIGRRLRFDARRLTTWLADQRGQRTKECVP